MFLDEYEFIVIGEYDNIYEDFNEVQKSLLDEPSNLQHVYLLSNYKKEKYRTLDFTGTTNRQAIQKILKFYTHKTFRRLLGDHVYFEGFLHEVIIKLGS